MLRYCHLIIINYLYNYNVTTPRSVFKRTYTERYNLLSNMLVENQFCIDRLHLFDGVTALQGTDHYQSLHHRQIDQLSDWNFLQTFFLYFSHLLI